MYEIEFSIPGLPKRTNNNHTSWRGRMAEARKWKRLIAEHVAFHLLKPTSPLKKAKLTLTRISTIEPDYDGLVSSFKHVIDGLIQAEIIENDKSANVGIPEYKWQKGKRNQGRIVIKVEGGD